MPEPGPGEVRIHLERVGLNYIDTYLRSGFYDPGPLPAVAGKEGAGRVDRLGQGGPLAGEAGPAASDVEVEDRPGLVLHRGCVARPEWACHTIPSRSSTEHTPYSGMSPRARHPDPES